MPLGMMLGVTLSVAVEIGQSGLEWATLRGLGTGPEKCCTRSH